MSQKKRARVVWEGFAPEIILLWCEKDTYRCSDEHLKPDEDDSVGDEG